MSAESHTDCISDFDEKNNSICLTRGGTMLHCLQDITLQEDHKSSSYNCCSNPNTEI